MKFCPECGTQITGSSKFCSNCGAHLNATIAGQVNAKTINKQAPILTSQSCEQRLENEWRTKPIFSTSLVGMFSVFVGGIVYGPAIFAYIQGESEYKIAKLLPESGVNLLVLLSIVGIAILVGVLFSKLKENYELYLGYAQKEYLELNEEGIIGRTAYESIKLSYEEIGRTEIVPNDQQTKFAVIRLNTLKIVTTGGNARYFYSFENARELSNAIQRYLANPFVQTAKTTVYNADSYATVELLSAGRVKCSKCGQVQMAGRTTCCSCNAKFSVVSTTVQAADNNSEQRRSAEEAKNENVAVAELMPDGREKCSACGRVQMAGRNVCWDCGVRFNRPN